MSRSETPSCRRASATSASARWMAASAELCEAVACCTCACARATLATKSELSSLAMVSPSRTWLPSSTRNSASRPWIFDETIASRRATI